MTTGRPDPKKHRRVKWRVRRCPTGWLAKVMIGEEPLVLGCYENKHTARGIARTRAAEMNGAGV